MGIDHFEEANNLNLMPKKARIEPIVKPREDLMMIESDNRKFNQDQHINYFNDFFGFRDKGKKQLHEGLPIVQRMNRDYNIVSNSTDFDKSDRRKGETIKKETIAQLNTENRYFLPPNIESIRNSVERAMHTDHAKKVLTEKKYLEKLLDREGVLR